MSTLAEIEAAVVTLTPEEMAHLETVLREARERAEEERLLALAHANGFHPFPKRSGGKVATVEIVRQIQESEDLAFIEELIRRNGRIRDERAGGSSPEEVFTRSDAGAESFQGGNDDGSGQRTRLPS